MNLAMLVSVGTLVSDPDTAQLPDGRVRTRLRLAAHSRHLDPHTGRWRDGDTTFLTVVAWRGLGALAAGLSRGDRVLVVGQLRQYEYARDGQRDIGYEVQAQHLARPLSPAAGRDSDAVGATAATASPS